MIPACRKNDGLCVSLIWSSFVRRSHGGRRTPFPAPSRAVSRASHAARPRAVLRILSPPHVAHCVGRCRQAACRPDARPPSRAAARDLRPATVLPCIPCRARVWMSCGCDGSLSTLSRRRLMYTFSVLSLTYSPALSQMALRTCLARDQACPGFWANSSSSRYSSAESCHLAAPPLRTTAAAASISTSPRRKHRRLAPEVRRSAARDAREQLAGAEGLGDVVVGPHVQARHGAVLVVGGGQEDDGRCRESARFRAAAHTANPLPCASATSTSARSKRVAASSRYGRVLAGRSCSVSYPSRRKQVGEAWPRWPSSSSTTSMRAMGTLSSDVRFPFAIIYAWLSGLGRMRVTNS